MATEKRLIDANAYIDELKWLQANVNSASAIEIQEYIDRANRQPTVDAVEVVHGRWINWGKSGTPTYENYGTCSVCHEDAEICTEHRNYCPNCGSKNDFCSYGERRTNEN